MPSVEPKALPTRLPVFPGCQSLSLICPMESSVLSRFAAADLFRRIKPCAIVALLVLGSSLKRGLRAAEDSNL